MLNKVQLIGNLGQDPEIRYTQAGNPVANFSLATSEKWKDKDGNKQEETQWHRIVAFGRLAEIMGEYLQKGSRVYIEGSVTYRTWEDQEGNTRYQTDIKAYQMLMLSASQQAPTGGGGSSGGYGSTGEDVPF